MATTTLTNEQILKQLNENTDLKSLAAVLAKLKLFREKEPSKKTNVAENKKLAGGSKAKLIGKKSGSSPRSSNGSTKLIKKKNGSDSESGVSQTSSGNSSKKRRSRGRRRRLRKQKQLQTERAAQLLAKMVGSQTVPPVQQTLSPPSQFFKYPKLLPTRDVLHDPMTGEMRPVWSVTIPMVCHKTNTPFYAQCSTARYGYCSRCGVLRKGNKQTGSCCSAQGCGERLTAKYHRWYPGLIRLEPYGDKDEERNVKDYEKNKELFGKFNIKWNSDDELNFVVENYLLMKVFLVSPDFDVAPLHVERTYMIGVFAGRKFHTGALARKFLRDGLRLMSFRADFPKSMKGMPEERSQVVEEMNQIFFQGRFRCYFHAHQSNIEGWYDPTQVDPATVQNYLAAVCQRYGKNITTNVPVSRGLHLSAESPVFTPSAKLLSQQSQHQHHHHQHQYQHHQHHQHHPHTQYVQPQPVRFQYPKTPGRFAFAAIPTPQNVPVVRKSNTADTSDSSDESSAGTPRSGYHIQSAPTAVSYMPVVYHPATAAPGPQFMTVPVATGVPHPYYQLRPPQHNTAIYTNTIASSDTGSQTGGTPLIPFQPIYS